MRGSRAAGGMLLAICLATVGGSLLAATPDPTANEIARAIEELGDPRFQVRQRASDRLWAAGAKAIPPLTAAAKQNDLETATRALTILAQLAQAKKEDAAVEALETLANDESLRISARANRLLIELRTTVVDRAIAALEATPTIRLGRNPNNNQVHWVQLNDDRNAYYLQFLPDLRTINLTGRDVSDECIPYITKMDQLTSISISDTAITADGVAQLAEMKNLVQINLMQQPLTGAGMKPLAKLKKLRTISLRGCPIDGDFSFLHDLEDLYMVSLSELQLGEHEVVELNRLNHLKYLQLSLTEADDSDLELIAKLEPQIYLQLSRCPDLTSAGYRSLADARLVSLYLFSTSIENDQLAHIGKITTLRSLGIYNASITDDALKHLRGLKALSSLNIRNTQVTEEAIAKLKESLPNFNKRRVPPVTGLKGVHVSTNVDKDVNNAHVQQPLTPEIIKELKKVPKLDQVYLSRQAQDEGLGLLMTVPLKGLVLSSSEVSGAGLEKISQHPHLRTLNIYNCKNIDDRALHWIARMPTLESLMLRNAPVTDVGVKQFISDVAVRGQLKSFRLTYCPQVTNEALQQVHQIPSLETLALDHNPKLTGELLVPIAKISTLKQLDLDEIPLSEDQLPNLLQLPNLESLSLAYSQRESPLTDKSLDVLGQLTKLQSLSIDKAQISDSGAAQLANLDQLEHLGLSYTPIGDATLEHVGNACTKLKRIALRGTKVSDAGMKHVGKMKQLEWLWLDKTDVGSEGISHLKPLKRLKYAYFDTEQISSQAHRRFLRDHPTANLQLQ